MMLDFKILFSKEYEIVGREVVGESWSISREVGLFLAVQEIRC